MSNTGNIKGYDKEYKDMIVDLYKSGMPLSKLNSEYGRGFAMQNLRENELMPLNGDTVIGGVLKAVSDVAGYALGDPAGRRVDVI